MLSEFCIQIKEASVFHDQMKSFLHTFIYKEHEWDRSNCVTLSGKHRRFFVLLVKSGIRYDCGIPFQAEVLEATISVCGHYIESTT